MREIPSVMMYMPFPADHSARMMVMGSAALRELLILYIMPLISRAKLPSVSSAVLAFCVALAAADTIAASSWLPLTNSDMIRKTKTTSGTMEMMTKNAD